MASNDYAVVVGINMYPSLGDLKGPENDAHGFRTWLEAPDGGCVPAENIEMVISSLYYDPSEQDPLKAKPTTEQVDTAFDRLIERGMQNSGRLGRRLYIFLAGHGFSSNIEDAALLMANAGKLRTGYHIPGRIYANWFRTAALFEEVVLFMDCCRDDYRRASPHFPPWPDIRSPQGANVRFFYGFATRWSLRARERVVNDSGAVHGLFTHALLTALKHTPPDERGCVTGDRLTAYVYNYLPKLVDRELYIDPEFNYDKYHDIVFAERRETLKSLVRISFPNPHPGQPLEIVDGKFQVVATRPAMSGVWELLLEPGRYAIRCQGQEQGQNIEVIGGMPIHETFG